MPGVRRWKGAVLAIALAAIAACARDAKEKAARADSMAAADSSAAATKALVGQPAPPEMPQSYRTISDSAFDAYLAKVRWLGAVERTGARICKGNVHSDKCRLDIDGVQGVKALDPRTMGRNGTIVARIRNLGTEDESYLGIPAGATRYFVMLRDSTGRASAVILDPAHRDGGRLLRVANCDSTKDAKHVHEAASRAAFRCCGNCPAAPPQKGGMQALMSTDTTAAATMLTAPPWVTCALGCCYVEDPI
ncbi:MAG TPA: hypothetical protein VGD77_04330 [Gemmatimonadaceae bacterium]